MKKQAYDPTIDLAQQTKPNLIIRPLFFFLKEMEMRVSSPGVVWPEKAHFLPVHELPLINRELYLASRVWLVLFFCSI